ncbi:MAG: N-acetyltransferase [Sulfuricaulis sp.]|uniref:GNAT family N-acetyltransferase n=1 Tax=Sulfuricaulis sp. TaxID=2003553 RepID=UPI003C50471F
MRIRRAKIDDLAMLVQLEERFPTDRLSRTNLRRLLRHGHASVWICEQDGVLAGNAVVLYRRGTSVARLYSLVVHPDYLRRGIARALLAAAESEAGNRGCRDLRLEVRPDNLPAMRLYRNGGYAVTGIAGKFYEDGTDALRMRKNLDPVTGAPAGRQRRRRPAPATPGATA